MKDYSVIIENLMDGIITNLEEAYDYGYDQGYEDGKKASCDCKDNMEAEYNRGLNEAWEMAKKLFKVPTDKIRRHKQTDRRQRGNSRMQALGL